MLTARMQAMKDKIFSTPRVISLERARLYTQSWAQTEGQPVVIRRARAVANVLANHRIVIEDTDLIVGNRSVTPRAGVVSPEMSPYWIADELDEFPTRPQDPFDISEADKAEYREELLPYWSGRSLNDWYRAHLDAEVAAAEADRVFSVAQTDKGQGHIICDFPLVLGQGYGAVLERARERAAEEPGNAFLEAAVISLEAMIAYIGRYECAVRELAANAPAPRAAELSRVAEVLAHIATEPARDFYDAVQLVWLTEVALMHESNASSLSLGRADQYLWPYYEASLTAGESPELIRELIQCLYLKLNTIIAVRSTESARFFAGFPIGFNLVVGGVDETGMDASNELSHLLLDVQRDTRLPQPNLSMRVHAGTPDSLLREACDVIRLGDGLPQLFNDEVNIGAFMSRGVAEADARDYAIVGCVELSIPGRMYGLHDISMFNMLRCLELTLDARPGGFASYGELERALEDTIAHYVSLMARGCDTCDLAHRVTSPTPLLSCLVSDCLERGLDVTEGGARYNPSGVQGVGTANLADSLVTLRRGVLGDDGHGGHVEPMTSYAKLTAAMRRDWTGEGDELLRQAILGRLPKYGNDVDEVDLLGRHFLEFYAHEVERYENVRGGRFQPGSYTVSAHVPLGAACGATPDGRHAHEQLADGGLSPMAGRDGHGPTASLMSVSKLNNALESNGSLLNVKFSPSALEGETGLAKLAAYIRAFSRLGIQHIQFNVVDRATLVDAQEHPERHRDLVVRVAGYSALFVELSRAIQDDIIRRTEHVL
mgnify:CR=1 FL=1